MPPNAVPSQGIDPGQNAHAHMVGHPAPDLLRLPAPAALRREVQGLAKAPAPHGPQPFQAPQIPHRPHRIQRQCQKAGIGRHHQVLVLAPLQRQGLDAAGFVAVAQSRIQGVERALRNAPRLPRRDPPLLGIEAEGAGLVKQASGLRGQKQRGHQVLEHGARPAGQAPDPVLLEPGPTQSSPVPDRRLAPGHRQVAGERGLAGHQIVPAARAALQNRVIADIEQLPLPVIQQAEVHGLVQGGRPPGKRCLPPGSQDPG